MAASRRTGLLGLALLAGPALAQEVADCGETPPVTALVEPWEETSASLGAGAIRLALLHAEGEEGVRLLVLTLPPPDPEEARPEPPVPRCRIVTEGGLGFAGLDLAGLEVEENPETATLTVTIPSLGFIPESTALEERALSLTFGVRDDALAAALEAP
ncbi:hypothetical protein [Rubellimicrobium roseum]|uniref:Invasion associated locus B family protein n=1 Tax=Rubellimicrobium roseum TaxID=687525 RepID=A0A5C4NCN6_9RHOB|nr:hypothetical protein [Rubellimicrobium roseum]TNC70324.1 hypothetical protein FHG71_13090 [Rubellimicrobium roseum]